MLPLISLRYVIVSLELYIILIYLLDLKRHRKVWSLNILIFILLVSVDLFLSFQGQSLDWAIRTLVSVFFAVPIIAYSIKDFKKIFLMIYGHLFASLITMIVGGMILTMKSVNTAKLTGDSFHAVLGDFSGLLMLLLMCIVTKKMNLKINVAILGLKEKIAIVFLTAIFGFFFVSFLQMEYTGWSEVITVLVMMSGIVALFGLIVYIAKVDHVFTSENKNKMYEELLLHQEVYDDVLHKKDIQTSKFVHDADKLLLPLAELVKNEELDGELAQLVENLKTTTTEIKSAVKFKTGSNILNSQLQVLIHKYRFDQVEFQLEGVFPENHRISVLDMISLFSNLLENAFEAVVQTNNDRQVRVEIKSETTSLCIRIENDYQGELKSKSIGFETTKTDKRNHGLGTQIIDEVVEKYNGRLKISTENNRFIAEITFPRTIYKRS